MFNSYGTTPSAGSWSFNSPLKKAYSDNLTLSVDGLKRPAVKLVAKQHANPKPNM
jgi:hypothetical protein